MFALLILPANVRAVESDPGDSGMLDRYLTQIAQKQLALRDAEIESLQTPAEIHARQKYIRERLLSMIGGLPAEKTPLNARVTGVLDGGDYTVEKVVFESQPRYYVTANVYVPKNAQPPFAAVLGPRTQQCGQGCRALPAGLDQPRQTRLPCSGLGSTGPGRTRSVS
jgi:hypothetical protein